MQIRIFLIFLLKIYSFIESSNNTRYKLNTKKEDEIMNILNNEKRKIISMIKNPNHDREQTLKAESQTKKEGKF